MFRNRYGVYKNVFDFIRYGFDIFILIYLFLGYIKRKKRRKRKRKFELRRFVSKIKLNNKL